MNIGWIRKNQGRIEKMFVSLLGLLILVWFVLSALNLQTNIAILEYNTDRVNNDNEKLAIEHIDTKGNLFLENTEKILDSDISEYIKVLPGTGSYYIPDGGMCVEVLSSECWGMGRGFLVLSGVVFALFGLLVCFTGSVWALVGYMPFFALNLLVLRAYGVLVRTCSSAGCGLLFGGFCGLFGVWVFRCALSRR